MTQFDLFKGIRVIKLDDGTRRIERVEGVGRTIHYPKLRDENEGRPLTRGFKNISTSSMPTGTNMCPIVLLLGKSTIITVLTFSSRDGNYKIISFFWCSPITLWYVESQL